MNTENSSVSVTRIDAEYPAARVVSHLIKVMEAESTPDKGERAAELLILAMRLQLDRERAAKEFGVSAGGTGGKS